MPVIVRGSGFSVGGGNSNKGYAPSFVRNLKAESGNGKILLSWSDPEDTALDEIVFVQWKGTVLVRKEESAPENAEDGVLIVDSTERNAYAIDPLQDSSIQENVTYYYRCFPYSEFKGERLYNMSVENVVKQSAFSYSEVFSENSWEQIVKVCKAGLAKQIWNIGDSKKMTIAPYQSSCGQQVTEAFEIEVQIAAFDEDKRNSNGTKDNLTTFICKEALPIEMYYDRYTGSYDSYGSSYMYSDFGQGGSVYNAIPEAVRNGLEQVEKWYRQRDNSNGVRFGAYLFALSSEELGETRYSSPDGETVVRYKIFTDSQSRIFKDAVTKSAANVWTRTTNTSSVDVSMYVQTNGFITTAISNTNKRKTVFGFCL